MRALISMSICLLNIISSFESVSIWMLRFLIPPTLDGDCDAG